MPFTADRFRPNPVVSSFPTRIGAGSSNLMIGQRGYDESQALEGAAGSAGRTESTSTIEHQAISDDGLFRPGADHG
jgi:hypothetical protein